jgi:Protein of unknown function (DUF2442)
MLNVTRVEHRGGYRLWLQFNDGAEGEVDLRDELDGPVFAPLRDPTEFARVRVDPEIRTITWPNGADFAPEFLRERLKSGVAAA